MDSQSSFPVLMPFSKNHHKTFQFSGKCSKNKVTNLCAPLIRSTLGSRYKMEFKTNDFDDDKTLFSTIPQNWSLFCDNAELAEYIDESLSSKLCNEQRPLMDPFDEKITLRSTEEQILLFHETTVCSNSHRIVLSDQAIYFISCNSTVERYVI